MSKPEERAITGKNYFAWNYEEQTHIKHKVLGAYVKIWISKLGAYNNTIFFDCHGGCGAYINKNNIINYGSTIIAKNIANEVNQNRKYKTCFFYCEKEKNIFDNFKKVIYDCGISKINMYNDDFENMITKPEIIKYYNTYPTLFFVDPFGYNLDIVKLSDLMKGHGNEIIINFMFDFINRFISFKDVEDCYNKFFGSAEWKNAEKMIGNERESFLVKLFKDKIKEITKAKYAFAYRLCYPDKKQTYYYLIHLTNHIDGISLMKSSFTAINNGKVEYLGKRANNYTLFDMESYKLNEATNFLLKKYQGKTVSFNNILEEIVEDTAYVDKELRNTIKDMEKNDKVTIKRITSKRSGINGFDEITF